MMRSSKEILRDALKKKSNDKRRCVLSLSNSLIVNIRKETPGRSLSKIVEELLKDFHNEQKKAG